MILDELFEGDLPSHIKKSDLPPGMRGPLTMRDVEAERPKGAYRFRVGDKEFVDQRSAQEFARGIGGRVEPVSQQPQGNQPRPTHRVIDPKSGAASSFPDQASAQRYATQIRGRVEPMKEGEQIAEELPRKGTPESVGYMYLAALDRSKKTREPVTLDYGAGNRIRITDPNTKAWFVNRFAEAQKMAKKNPEYLSAFLINMGTLEGVRALMRRMQQDVPAGQQNVAEVDQKKRSDLAEREKQTINPRTKRIMGMMRARQPQARSDAEAMLYDFMAAQKKDRQDIQRLEKQRDDLEQDIKKDLEKDIASLKQRRGQRTDLSKIQAKNQQQDQAIQRIASIQQEKDRLDREQQQEIDNLEKAVAGQPAATSAPAAMPMARDQTRAAPAAPKPVAKDQPAKTADNGAEKSRLSPQGFAGMVQGLTPASTAAAAPVPATPKKSASVTQLIPKGRRRERQATLDLGGDEDQLKVAAESSGSTGLRVRRDENENIVIDEASRDRSPGKIDASEDPCWSGYHMVGTKKKGGRTVPNCVPGKKGSST